VVQQDQSDQICNIHENGVDVENRHIWLAGETNYLEPGDEPGVEYQMSTRLIKNLHILTTESHEPILIHMKTCGGFVEEGLAIYDALEQCPCEIRILSYTHARSMSSYILQAADWRALMPRSHFLFHRGTFGMEDRVTAVEKAIDWGKSQEPVLMDIYVNRMKQEGIFKSWKKSRIIKMMEKCMRDDMDVYLTAKEAVDWGLADEVLDKDWSRLLPHKQN